MDALLSQIARSPKLKLYVDALSEALRREATARERFRAEIDEDVRAEFINGETFTHVTAKYKHNSAVSLIARLLSVYVDTHRLGVVHIDHALAAFTRNDYLPDIGFWAKAKASAFDGDQVLYPVPDFICEVLSPSTERNDRGVKFEDYAAHGVLEYWIADPDARTIEQYVLRGEAYELVAKSSNGTLTSQVIEGLVMPVEAAFNDDANLRALWAMQPKA